MTTTSTTTAPVETHVALFREANRRIRTMTRNGGADGRNAGAITRCQAEADRAMRSILDAGERRIAGDLTDEASVIDSIASSRTERPELDARLVLLRREVRRCLAAIRGL